MSRRSDRESLKREVFAVIFDMQWTRVRRHVESHLMDDRDVDDVVADVFRVAWQKLDPYHPMGLTWLLRTAQNKLRDRERSSVSRERALEALHRAAQEGPDDPDLADRIAVRSSLDALSDHERKIVVLTYWDELSAGEIAEILRMSQGAVWTTLSRARSKMRSQLTVGEKEVRIGGGR